jgi:hypothetical protein
MLYPPGGDRRQLFPIKHASPPSEKERWDQAAANTDSAWYCAFCQELTHRHGTAPGDHDLGPPQINLPNDLKWLKVEWKPTPEPLDKIEALLSHSPAEHAHLLNKLSQLKAAQEAPPTKRQRPSDNYGGSF